MQPLEFDEENLVSGLAEENDLHREECALVFALQLCLTPRTRAASHLTSLRGLLRCVFPWGMGSSGKGVGSEHDPVLVDAIQNQFVADNLQATPQHVSKVRQIVSFLLQPINSQK